MRPHAELVSRLRAAWLSGKTRPMEYRLAQLEALGRFLDEKKRDILQATAADMRKPPFEVEVSELSMCRSELNHTLNKLGTWVKDKHVEKNWATQLDSAFIRKDPYGVVLIIGPWNYPINLLLVPLIGAIAAGNCVVMKPSEITRNVERLVAETLPRYLDEDCFAVVTAGVEETTRLLENKFDYILFTGSPSVGRIVMTAAAKHLTPVTLELGGKNKSGQLLWPRPCSREEGAPTSPAVHVLVYPRQQGGGSQGVVNRVLERTSSGDFCANDTIMHMTIPSLPFGSIGQSGLGRNHGRSSFETFSHQPSALLRGSGRETFNTPRYPPYAPHRLPLLRAATETKHRAACLLPGAPPPPS
ncbi:LOW QUALITY PROTEIN: aldehyde dehydrogenase family 3 member B1-like [Harpia harpyja]|uniref:LOW QUALITY PROTEIN: aldehyde dehydrogenase family 3 member B1-like n=1 Tax=Harpia harpyja TaxID=202280 RepID=UPI0022B1715C|nr:LOW QUALITY PROTEIN: aldehyde dehydrogenase family 3 member B1-like [Harpia harpyja]